MIFRLLIVLGLAGLALVLNHLFPDALTTRESQIHLISLLLVTTLCAGALLHYRHRWGEGVRNALIWLCIGAVLVVGYSFRDEFGARLRGELLPATLTQTAEGAYAIRTASDGHFYLLADVNGANVRFMVDTGASEILLPYDVAARIGLPMDGLKYTNVFSTANGTAFAARVRLASVTVGPRTFTDLDAFVSREGLDVPLLGMSFLRQLRGFSVDGDRLLLSF